MIINKTCTTVILQMSHKKLFKCLYPGCLISPREKRSALLHYIRSHLQPKEAPFYCKECDIGMADLKHREEHVNSRRHQKKQQKKVGQDCTPVANGKSLDITSWLVEVKKPEVATDGLCRRLSSMSKEEQDDLILRLSSGGNIIKLAIQETFGKNWNPEMEVEVVQEDIVIEESQSDEKESVMIDDSDDEDPQEKVLKLAAQAAEESSPQMSPEELQKELIEMAASASQEMKEHKEADPQEEMLILAARAAEEQVNENDAVSILVDDSEFKEEEV